jgi:phosphoserine phosphatase RsbU/P
VRDLFLLQRVAQRINGNLDLDALLEEIVTDVAETFGCSRSAVLLKDENAGELIIAAVRGWTMNVHRKGDRFVIGRDGMIGHVAATERMRYAPDVMHDQYYQVSEPTTRSEVDIPLMSHGRLIGVFNAQHTDRDAFSSERLQLFEALAGHITTAIENARLFRRERHDKERMRRELTEAQRIQRSLFPSHSPSLERFAVAGHCRPCEEVGGDWYDFVSLPDGRLGIVLADVSGKGMGAALLMSSTRTVLRLVAESGAAPGKVLGRVNEILLRDFPSARFVTMVYAIFDPRTGEITFANAGHSPPLHISGTSAEFVNTDSGTPLGMMESSFSERTLTLKEGERILLYSDGVTEAMNTSMDQYGEVRLRDFVVVKQRSILDLVEDVQSFSGTVRLSDDLTVVVISALPCNEDG